MFSNKNYNYVKEESSIESTEGMSSNKNYNYVKDKSSIAHLTVMMLSIRTLISIKSQSRY